MANIRTIPAPVHACLASSPSPLQRSAKSSQPATTSSPFSDPSIQVLRRYIKVDNEIREPVIKDEIVSEVTRQLRVSIQPENLHLPTPLSSIGEFEVPLRLPKAIPLPEGKIMRSLNIKIRRK